MSKLMYIVAILVIAFSFNAYAEENCPEGKIFDPELEICVGAPEEA